jgi:hypothetical protein
MFENRSITVPVYIRGLQANVFIKFRGNWYLHILTHQNFGLTFIHRTCQRSRFLAGILE